MIHVKLPEYGDIKVVASRRALLICPKIADGSIPVAKIANMSASFKSTISTLESIDPSQFRNDAERFQAKEALRKLLVRMETPFERIWALSFENPPLIAGLRICVDLGLWEKWATLHKEKGQAELTLDQITAMCDKKPQKNLLRM